MRFLSNLLNNNQLSRWFKNARNKFLNDRFKKSVADRIVMPPDWIPEKSSAVVFSIAFNKRVCVEVMIESWKLHARNTDLVIVDNSSKLQAREEIQSLCLRNNIPYIGLPKNPEWNQNRSHALSMNWVYYNLVLNWKPQFFGFLDHDCFPFALFDLSETMEKFDLFGNKRFPKSRKYNQWNLWAGFCFYRLCRIQKININFTHSIELNLDTGGSNYNPLYRYIRDGEVIFAERKDVPNEELFAQMSYILDNRFLHIGGASHRAHKTFDSKSVLLCLKELVLRK
jgi:hypothetical protein